MKKITFLRLICISFLLTFGFLANAQIGQGEKNRSRDIGVSSMQECMTEIATDKTLRTEMMTLIMENMKGDTASMRQVCREMMKDPEMHRMMMQMMDNANPGMGKMKSDDIPTNLLDSTGLPNKHSH